MQHLQPTSTLQGGKYKIVRFLSSGGFGNTYEGVHTMMDTRVAIKEFFPKMFCNRDENTSHVTVATQGNRELVDKLRKKFKEEAKAVFQMNHPNIVRVLDIFEENGTAYYVMEYIDGKSLNEITKERGALPESEAVGYIRQVADALKYVHSLNRLHLDIKPGNVMVDKNGKAILIDFGASKQYDEEGGENTSTLLGKTPGYAPLEQMGNDVVKFLPSTDIYALGATLYKLLTGNTPPSASLLASGEKLGAMPSSISEGTRNAIIQSMQTNKMKRPQSIEEFLCVLAAEADESTIVDGGDVSSDEENIPKKPTSKKVSKKEPMPALPQEDVVEESIGNADEDIDLPKKKWSFWQKLFIFVICAAFAIIAILFFVASYIETEVTTNQVANEVFEYNGESITYSGEIRDNLPNGNGTALYPHGWYEGTFVDGARHGKGTFTDTDGGVFIGLFANDEYSEGKYTKKDGTYFEGTFLNQQPCNGIWYTKDGSVVGYVNEKVFSEPQPAKKKTNKNTSSISREESNLSLRRVLFHLRLTNEKGITGTGSMIHFHNNTFTYATPTTKLHPSRW